MHGVREVSACMDRCIYMREMTWYLVPSLIEDNIMLLAESDREIQSYRAADEFQFIRYGNEGN